MTNESKHGGLRNPSGGRPRTIQEKKQRLIIDASDKEYLAITGKLTTRERTVILLQAIKANESND